VVNDLALYEAITATLNRSLDFILKTLELCKQLDVKVRIGVHCIAQ